MRNNKLCIFKIFHYCINDVSVVFESVIDLLPNKLNLLPKFKIIFVIIVTAFLFIM